MPAEQSYIHQMLETKRIPSITIRVILILYAIALLTLILLAASNYSVQWKAETDRERGRYLDVYAQALEYYYYDHDAHLPPLPVTPSIISTTDACQYACPALGTDLSCFNLASSLVPQYMQALLQDPLLDSTENSGFYIQATETGFHIGTCYQFFNAPQRVIKNFAS